MGRAEPAEVADAVVEGVARRIEEGGTLHPGVVDAIERLERAGVRLALASSSPMRLIRAVLAMGGLDGRFDAVVTGEDEERGKPDPAVYLSAARALGVVPDRCLAIEDSINGVRAAKAAGWCASRSRRTTTTPTSGGGSRTWLPGRARRADLGADRDRPGGRTVARRGRRLASARCDGSPDDRRPDRHPRERGRDARARPRDLAAQRRRHGGDGRGRAPPGTG